MDFATPTDLPGYTPSAPLPSYSIELACGEQRLQHTPRLHATRPPPTSAFVKKAGKVTIVLNEQEDGASVPSYGRHSVINGTVQLEQPENILEIVAYVEAKLDTTISEAGGRSVKLLHDRYSMWSHTSAPHEECPRQISFAFILPSTFKDGDETGPLPPSYHQDFIDVPTLFVRASYQLHFVVSRIRHQKLGGVWSKTKHITVPFTYTPRTRAHRPILPSPCFFSSVKTSPEEWYQAVTCLKTRPNVKIDPVNCHLFIPAGRIYGLKDTIPFHVQLVGNTCNLKELFSEMSLDRVMSADSHNTVVSHKPAPTSKPLVRVYLLRQISVSLRGASSWRNVVLGEGTIYPVPPELSTCCSTTSGCQEAHVDWEGELRCQDAITVGAFNAANVQVKDFIALSLTPPNRQSSALLDLQISVPIRLVTDSFADAHDLDTATL